MSLERLGLGFLHQLDPERAHALSLAALRLGLGTSTAPVDTPRLRTRLAGLELPNPLGLAAGLDKNAEAVDPLLRVGFGFIEVGAATPEPQPGNQRPRVFRLKEDRAVINRYGFNNDGMRAIARRLARRRSAGIVGLNLGANKNSEDRSSDFARVLAHCGNYIDFATVNVSSPNTERLRDLQGKDALRALLAGVIEARDGLTRPIPVFLKISPDLTDTELADVVDAAIDARLAGIVATNTTLSRPHLSSKWSGERGGLSGQPLFGLSTRVLAKAHLMAGSRMPMIGVGGIATGQQAYDKIRAGASALQIYTALVYGGPGIIRTILRDLDVLLGRDGFSDIADAVGVEARSFADS